jgi:hypothetical protein
MREYRVSFRRPGAEQYDGQKGRKKRDVTPKAKLYHYRYR